MRQDLAEACNILGIKNLESVNSNNIKKYRNRAIKKFHPDSMGHDTKESRIILQAYNKLSEFLAFREMSIQSDRSSSNTKKKLVVNMETLIKICLGETVDAGNGYGILKYTSLQSFCTVVKIKYTIWINGNRRDLMSIRNFEYSNKYSITEYLEYSMNDTIEIDLYGNKTRIVGNGVNDIINMTVREKGDFKLPKVTFILMREADSN